MATLRSIFRQSVSVTSLYRSCPSQRASLLKPSTLNRHFNKYRNIAGNAPQIHADSSKRNASTSKPLKVNALSQVTLVYSKGGSAETRETMTFRDAVKRSKHLNKVLVPVEDMHGNISAGEFSLQTKSSDEGDEQSDELVSKSKKIKTVNLKAKIEEGHLEMKISEMNEWLFKGHRVCLIIAKPGKLSEDKVMFLGKRLLQTISRGVEKFGEVPSIPKNLTEGTIKVIVTPHTEKNTDQALKPLQHNELRKNWTKKNKL